MAGKSGISGTSFQAARIRDITEKRILDYAAAHLSGKFTQVLVRFRGAFCYIDAIEGGPGKVESEPLHLCRLRYHGDPDRWGFAFYTYAHEKYEPSFLLDGSWQGTPELALETSTQFY